MELAESRSFVALRMTNDGGGARSEELRVRADG